MKLIRILEYDYDNGGPPDRNGGEMDDRNAMDMSSNSNDSPLPPNRSSNHGPGFKNDNNESVPMTGTVESKDEKRATESTSSSTNEKQAPSNDEETKAGRSNQAAANQPQVSTVAEDISKYYKPELLARLNGFIALNEV
jgi:hypothetical protein